MKKIIILKFLRSKTFRNIKIGLVSSFISGLFFYYLLDSIVSYEDNILINTSLLFSASLDPLINGSGLFFSHDPELYSLLFFLLGICSFSAIVVISFYLLRFKLKKLLQWGSDSEDHLNKKSWIFQIILQVKNRWVLISLSLIIFIIAVLTLRNLIIIPSNALLF
ncbi:MAG: hypothetical protein P4L35_05530 [Ignavibacteriaceae bacterium]|nr:hypothetical protein [Ignavibacteriaceae bacterium]